MIRKTLLMTLLVALLIGVAGCGQQSSGGTTGQGGTATGGTTSQSTAANPSDVPAVCLMENQWYFDDAGGEGVGTTALGESVNWTGRQRSVAYRGTTYDWIEVRLSDDTVAWAIASVFETNARGAVIRVDTELYDRPNLTNIWVGHRLAPLQIVAVSTVETNQNFDRISWREGWTSITAWVPKNMVSFDNVDIAVARYAAIAASQATPEESLTRYNEILANAAFNNSALIPFIQARQIELAGPPAQETSSAAPETSAPETAAEAPK